MRNKSKEIALSGISSALAIVFILGAVYIPNITLSCYVLAAISISLPLMKEYIIGSIFSYVVSSIIAFLLANINILPFIIFFGPYSIILWLLDFKFYNIEKLSKMVKIIIITVIKWICYVAAFFSIFYLMKIVLTDFTLFNVNWTMPLLFFAGLLVFSVYDIVYREVFKVLNNIIQKRIK